MLFVPVLQVDKPLTLDALRLDLVGAVITTEPMLRFFGPVFSDGVSFLVRYDLREGLVVVESCSALCDRFEVSA